MTITNNVSNYNDVSLANQSSLGSLPEALFFMPYWSFVMLNLFQHPDSEISSH